MINVDSYIAGSWISPGKNAREIKSAVSGELIARTGGAELDTALMLNWAMKNGGSQLRELGFHDRAKMVKSLAIHLGEHKQVLYDLSYHSGTTKADAAIDIDGGIGTLFAFASKGRRELPDAQVYLDGNVEQLSRDGSFIGQHICLPRHGISIQINAFNFPIWGMLEKLAPTILAGMPVIVKPATVTSYITQACVKLIVDSEILPEGSIQFIGGDIGDLLDRLSGQDMVSFTGSANTANLLRSNRNILEKSVSFSAEQDSLNGSILGPDADPGSDEFDLFVGEVIQEMTVKTGQKCTAIRRIMVQEDSVPPLLEALTEKLSNVRIGDPRLNTTQMGPLVSVEQCRDVERKSNIIASQAKMVFGSGDLNIEGVDAAAGAFVKPTLFYSDDPLNSPLIHSTEAFGPIATLMGYKTPQQACQMLNMGGGSLVASVFTHDPKFASEISMGSAAFHGRIYINNRDSADAATGHGSPVPHMVHGGPGRAGGGEELGGIRSVLHHMQRTAIQGSPDMISHIGQTWVSGAKMIETAVHPFRKSFDELQIGETLLSDFRRVELRDIELFAEFTGDNFYAHMDEEAAGANPFFPGRVAHGYLLLSFAAGLFVEPSPGPVLANTGLDNLRFIKPVSPGDAIRVRITVKRKTNRNDEYGEIRWHVLLENELEEPVASYELITMNAK